MRRLIAALAFAALLLVPGALADAIQGSISSPSVEVSGTLRAEYAPFAAYWPEASAIETAQLVAPELKVTRWNHTQITAGPVMIYPPTRSISEFVLHNVTVQIRGGKGFLGAYGEPGASWSSEGVGAWTLESRETSTVGNTRDLAQGGPYHDAPSFAVETDAPHVLATMGGRVLVAGHLLLKVVGPTLHLEAAENTTDEWTGESTPAPGVSQSVWLLLEATDARLDVESQKDVVVAAPDVRGHVAGAMSASDAVLDARTTSRALRVDGDTARLEGSFDFLAQAQPQASSALRVGFTGNVSEASTRAVPIPVWQRGDFAWLAGGGLLVLVAAVAVTTRARRKPNTLSVEQCVQLAGAAAEEGDMQTALDWTRRAQELAPTSARLRTDEGYYLQEMGDYEGALATLAAASQMASDGEAPYLAAVLLATRMGDPARAEEHLAIALRQSPVLVLEAEDDERVAPLLRRPLARSAAMRAHRELDKDESLAS